MATEDILGEMQMICYRLYALALSRFGRRVQKEHATLHTSLFALVTVFDGF